MITRNSLFGSGFSLWNILLAVLCCLQVQARVLDDFNDNNKTGWTDFTFAPGAGSMVEQSGQFKFEIPAAVPAALNSALFCASTKSSEQFTLQEGRTIEFRVDIVQGGGADSFAILGFLPASSSNPSQLKGYSLAKSTTDALMAKGINQYFVDNNASEGAPAKQDNTTLVLTLSVKNGSVIFSGKILDKDANDAVLWERTVVDTPQADPLDEGTDNPATPFIEAGNFVLYLYADYSASSPEDPYKAYFDNAQVFVTDSLVLDDFNDNVKSNWVDFKFAPQAGSMVEQAGQFRFDIPGAVAGAVGQVFCASTKTSPLVEVKEGERVEFQVDVVNGGLKDSFAILSFVPASAGNPGTLKGYSFAKSITDVLIVKGLGQYFVADDDVTAELKQDNITMAMSLTTIGGVVTVDARILDKADNNAVIWHQTIRDTPAADVMADGTDNPAAPYIETGNFVLMLFADYDAGAPEDPYFAIFDNAIIAVPPQAGNAAPLIGDILPADRANFVAAPATISFTVSDDQALSNDKISVMLNGTNYTTANGLSVTGTGSSRTVSLGGLGADINYIATLQVEDAGGLVTTRNLYFDTFQTSHFTLELENFNFAQGLFIENPVPIMEGTADPNSYSYLIGVENVDVSDTRTGPAGVGNGPYRPDDEVRMARTRDNVRAKYTAAGGSDAGVFDYDIGDIAAGEWLNYTHTFPAGSYEVYLRQAVANLPTAESVLEKVTSDRTQENQTTELLGSFLGTLTGFTYRNFALTDASGQNKVVLRLDGTTTLRLRQVTADTGDGERRQNYLIFIPVADVGPQRATVSAVEPASGSTVQTVSPVVSATILNRDTSVDVSSIKLEINGQVVPAQVVSNASGATLSYPLDPLPAAGATTTARISFKDNQGQDVSTTWQFVVSYASLDPALRVAGTGQTRGFNVRVVQAEVGQPNENSLAYAESLLRPSPARTLYYDTNVVEQVINFSQDGPGSANGSFPDDLLVPGLDPGYSTEDIAMEATAYLELPTGKYRFGVNSDDGYKVQVVPSFTARDTGPLAFHNGGPANETFDFVVPQGGLYRFRLVWYERGGGAHVEFFQGNFNNADRVLLNTTGSINAFTTFVPAAEPPKFTGVSVANGQLTITWTGTGVLEESSNLQNWTPVSGQPAGTYTVPVAATGSRFFRLKQ